MIEKIKNLREIIKKAQKQDDEANIKALTQEVKELKLLIVNMLLEQNLKELKEYTRTQPAANLKPQPSGRPDFNFLKDITDFKQKDDSILFLLHTPNIGKESEDGKYISQKADWYVKFEDAVNQKSGGNPVISCWVPAKNVIESNFKKEDQIEKIGEDLTQDPIRLTVDSGQYEVYGEFSGQ